MTATATSNGRIVHVTPGRIRVKMDDMKGNRSLADAIQHRLSAVQGVKQVTTNPVTGSVLVCFDPEALTGSWDSLIEIAGTFGLLSSNGYNREQLEQWMQMVHSGGVLSAPSTVSGDIETLFGSLNTWVGKTAGGRGDLRDIVPLALVFLGVRSLLFSRPAAVPTWYDYFWFAFSIFVAFHRQKDQRSVQASG